MDINLRPKQQSLQLDELQLQLCGPVKGTDLEVPSCSNYPDLVCLVAMLLIPGCMH